MAATSPASTRRSRKSWRAATRAWRRRRCRNARRRREAPSSAAGASGCSCNRGSPHRSELTPFSRLRQRLHSNRESGTLQNLTLFCSVRAFAIAAQSLAPATDERAKRVRLGLSRLQEQPLAPARDDALRASRARQRLVFDTMRLIRLGAKAAMAVGFVIGVVALEPHDLAVALEGDHMRGDAVEEPAVMGDDDGASGKLEERLFERAQRIDIEIVGRLVQQDDIGGALQHLRQMHAVALATR